MGDRTSGQLYCRGLAARGFLLVAVDFRQGPSYKHPTASCDVTAAVRFVRANADQLGADQNHIGLSGSSSGGHLALLAGIKPDADFHRGTPILGEDGEPFDPQDVTATVDCVVALWPVSNPRYRYRYAQASGREELVRAHEGYYVDESAMEDASVPRILDSKEAQDLPTVLVVQPGEDRNVPLPMTLDLIRAYQDAGGCIEYAFYPGQAHGFANHQSPVAEDCMTLIASFLQRRLRAQKRLQ
jgi:acetyl esterase/lipase